MPVAVIHVEPLVDLPTFRDDLTGRKDCTSGRKWLVTCLVLSLYFPFLFFPGRLGAPDISLEVVRPGSDILRR